MSGEKILECCQSLLGWGDQYEYHWFWGLTKAKQKISSIADAPSSLPHKPTINQLISYFDNTIGMAALRSEVEAYRKRGMFVRFFIRFFNYDNLTTKSISLAYYDMKNYLIPIKEKLEENMKNQEQKAPNFIPRPEAVRSIPTPSLDASEKQKKEAISNVGVLGKVFKNYFKFIVDAFSSNARGDSIPCLVQMTPLVPQAAAYASEPPDHSIPVASHPSLPYSPTKKNVRIYNNAQLEALTVLGMPSYKIGGFYSQEEFKSQWIKLAKSLHADKGGNDQKFIEINKARHILEYYARRDEDSIASRSDYNSEFSESFEDRETSLSNEFLNKCSQCHSEAYAKWIEKLRLFRENMFQAESIGSVEDYFASLSKEGSMIILAYQEHRGQVFKEYLEAVKNLYATMGYHFNPECEMKREAALEREDEGYLLQQFNILAESVKELALISVEYKKYKQELRGALGDIGAEVNEFIAYRQNVIIVSPSDEKSTENPTLPPKSPDLVSLSIFAAKEEKGPGVPLVTVALKVVKPTY